MIPTLPTATQGTKESVCYERISQASGQSLGRVNTEKNVESKDDNTWTRMRDFILQNTYIQR
jgi:hypothetical protein